MSKKFLNWHYIMQDDIYIFGRIESVYETNAYYKFIANEENNPLQQKIIDALNDSGVVQLKFETTELANEFRKAINSISTHKVEVFDLKGGTEDDVEEEDESDYDDDDFDIDDDIFDDDED